MPTPEYHDGMVVQPHLLKNVSERDAHWDTRKQSGESLVPIFTKGNAKQTKKAERLTSCANTLIFGIHMDLTTKEKKHKLRHAKFCHVRLCPICMHRKSLVWRARLHKAYPILKSKYPSVIYLNLTLTMKNCHVSELREALGHFTASFKRLNDRLVKSGILLGFLRSVEITREMNYCDVCKGDYKKKDTCPNNKNHTYNENCHPHGHVTIAVPSYYFGGKYYITHELWVAYWKKALKADYDPNVWIQRIKGKKATDDQEQALGEAIKETTKYCVKMDAEFLDSVLKDEAGEKWFLELDRQIAGTRAVGLGGIFKEVMQEADPDDAEMLNTNDEDENEILAKAEAFWQYFYGRPEKAYVFKKVLAQEEVNAFEKIAEEGKEKGVKKAKAKAEVAKNKRERKALAGGELKARPLKVAKKMVGIGKLRKFSGKSEERREDSKKEFQKVTAEDVSAFLAER